jgi:hypothetical protein
MTANSKDIGITPELTRRVYRRLESEVGSNKAAQDKRLKEILASIVAEVRRVDEN